VGVQRLAYFALELWDAVVPGAELRRVNVGEEVLQPPPDYSRLGHPEVGEV
jgi:hypothetical protein